MKLRKPVIVALVLVLVAAAGGYYWRQTRAPANGTALRVSGNIEVTEAEVSFKIAGRVEKRLVDEGELVKRGDTVALLDQSDLVADVAVRRAQLDAVQAALAELEAGSRPEEIAAAAAVLEKAKAFLAEFEAGSRPQEIAVSEAAVARARADWTNAETNYQRVKELHAQQMSAQQEYDTAKAAFDAAAARLDEAVEQLKLVKEGPRQEAIEQARAALAQVQQQYNLAKEGPRKETIEQARARVAEANASLGLAETRLGYATLAAPLAGVVLSKNIEPGEYVAAGTPVVTVGDLEHVWLRAYINETDLGRVKVGQRARVMTDTYPGKAYDGRLAFISAEAEFTPKNVQTAKERVKLVYRVKIDLQNPSMELKPGMPADAEILLDNGH